MAGQDGSSNLDPSRRRTPSPPSSPGLLSKLPFMRAPTDNRLHREDLEDETSSSPAPARSLAAAVQQQKTRRRRGSLRKVALLGRGAQHDRRDSRSTSASSTASAPVSSPESAQPASASDDADRSRLGPDALGLTTAGPDGHTSVGGYTGRPNLISLPVPPNDAGHHPDREAGVPDVYTSTTDEEDVLQIPHGPGLSRSGLSKSPGSDSYFTSRDTAQLPRSFQQAKSPLSFSGLSSTTLPASDSDWDYAETEWWGWVVLCVTWFVFVIGMGSCLGVWSWAWDVGKTPYAPPELEDDPTLPLVGYYPALIILTGVMAWVWVVVAWVGMKYFRHAKISGD